MFVLLWVITFFCVFVFLFFYFFPLSGEFSYHSFLFLFYSLVVVVEGISPSLCPFFLSVWLIELVVVAVACVCVICEVSSFFVLALLLVLCCAVMDR